MAVLEILGWSLTAAAAAWGITLSWAKAAFDRSCRAAQDEVRYWQAETVRARELVAQLRHERAAWSEGCQQGRRDVIAAMPLLVATQQGLIGTRVADATNADC